MTVNELALMQPCEHLYPDPGGFVVDAPMGRYTGVTEMIEMSRTPGEYKPRWVRGNQAGSNRSELKSNWQDKRHE
jgi:hypothetical protein